MKKWIYILPLCFFYSGVAAQKSAKNGVLQIVFTSDAHFGIHRQEFRGDSNVSANIVNKAMVKKINTLPGSTLPADGGVGAGKKINFIDYVVEGGDIANRMEVNDQPAAKSWAQFQEDYIDGIHVKDHYGKRATLFMIPGNHDISDAIGFYRPMHPPTDPTSMVKIYNLMLHPAVPKTNGTYHYKNDRINYSKNIGGIHFMFITLWPDSLERIWMRKDLEKISSKTPVIIFTHDEPVCEAKQFTNPNPGHSINPHDKFENLLAEVYKDSSAPTPDGGNTTMEQEGWVSFLKQHPNIKAYFHGNDNFSEFYDYHGPDSTVSLPVFRVDSPMKGDVSRKDETKLSFMLISIDTEKKIMTARECLWNEDPKHPEKPVHWGAGRTISLSLSHTDISKN